MRSTPRYFLVALLALVAPAMVPAQTVASNLAVRSDSGPAIAVEPVDTARLGVRAPAYIVRPTEIQYFRQVDQRGINVFEAPKEAGVAYTGFKLNFGAAFTQQYRASAITTPLLRNLSRG